MAKFWTLGPLNAQEIEVVVVGLNLVIEKQGSKNAEDRRLARSAMKNLDPRIVTKEEVQA